MERGRGRRLVPRIAIALATCALALCALAPSGRAQGEPNDTCATASPLAPGTYTGLWSDDYYNPPCCEGTDFDHYRVVLQPGERLEFRCMRTSSTGQPASLYVRMNHLLPGCPGVYQGQAFVDSGAITVANDEPVAREYDFQVYAWLVNEGYATIYYSIDLFVAPDACPGAVDDAFEPPPSSQHVPIGFGPHTGLFARYFDDDLYTLRLTQGTTVRVQVDLQHALGDLDLTVYDGFQSASSTSLTDQEVATFTRSVVAGAGYTYIRVAPKPGAVSVCNHYALTVEVLGTPLGSSYCLAGVNGYGTQARILPEGSSSVSANALRFWCQAFPGASPCLLVAATQPTQVPFGDGWRCVGGTVVRLGTRTAAERVAVFVLDLASAPADAITPGATWNFQVFYRDATLPAGTGFNLTNAVAIPMTP